MTSFESLNTDKLKIVAFYSSTPWGRRKLARTMVTGEVQSLTRLEVLATGPYVMGKRLVRRVQLMWTHKP